MRARAHKGQMLVATVLVMGLVLMSVLVVVYQTHSTFLMTRSLVTRETVGAITGDFNRALAAALAATTRLNYNSTRFSALNQSFPGIIPGNIESAKNATEDFLEKWVVLQLLIFGERAPQIEWAPGICDVSGLLGRSARVNLLFMDWNQTTSGSYACAKLRLNLTGEGFYGWEVKSLIGLTLTIIYVNSTTLEINVLADNGTYYGNLLAKGWVEVYYSTGKGWIETSIKDVTYEGFGNYRLTLKNQLPKGAIVQVVASDERGIIVVSRKTYQ